MQTFQCVANGLQNKTAVINKLPNDINAIKKTFCIGVIRTTRDRQNVVRTMHD